MVRGTCETSTPSPKSVPQGVVPAGAPNWVTSELLAQTIEVWQPYYREPLTSDDALEMLLGVGRLLRVLANSPSDDRA